MNNPILLLHGALGSEPQLQLLKKQLSDEFSVHSFNFSGHGGRELPEHFSIKLFAEDVLHFCEANKLQNVILFGYSMGGYVALYLARHYPQLVSSVVTLGTKLHWDAATAARETAMMQPTIIEQKVTAFAQQLQQRHSPADWKVVMHKTAQMLTAMGNENPIQTADYKLIQAPVLLMLGDRDKMVSLDETVAVYKQLTNAQLAVLPATSHAIEMVDVKFICTLIKKFVGLVVSAD